MVVNPVLALIIRPIALNNALCRHPKAIRRDKFRTNYWYHIGQEPTTTIKKDDMPLCKYERSGKRFLSNSHCGPTATLWEPR